MRVKHIMEKRECRVPGLLSVGSGSAQGGLVVQCLWDWLPVIVNLSPCSVKCTCVCVRVCEREKERDPEIRVCRQNFKEAHQTLFSLSCLILETGL